MVLINLFKNITKHPLNRNRKLAAIIRFMRWQIGSRLVPGEVIYEWINGSKFIVKTGETGLTGNIYNGLDEFPDMGYLLHFLRKDDLFIDVGANVGSYTILACSAIGSRGIAFEPVPSTYKRFVENLHINRLDEKVRGINKGVGAVEGVISFTSDNNQTNHALAQGEKCKNAISVDVTTLDAVLHDEFPVLIKIDVEGFETHVLEGAENTLQNRSLKSVIMELNGSGSRYGFSEKKIVEKMFDLGFETYSYNPLSRSFKNLKGKNLDSGNTIFIRDKDFVDNRISNAPKVSVFRRDF